MGYSSPNHHCLSTTQHPQKLYAALSSFPTDPPIGLSGNVPSPGGRRGQGMWPSSDQWDVRESRKKLASLIRWEMQRALFPTHTPFLASCRAKVWQEGSGSLLWPWGTTVPIPEYGWQSQKIKGSQQYPWTMASATQMLPADFPFPETMSWTV